MRSLVLASQSPRRSELLTAAGISFTVRARPVREEREPDEQPDDYVRRLAWTKASASWASGGHDPNEIVLGADTVVVLDQEVLEKPRDVEDAKRMLGLLSGREHIVMTGICLRVQDASWSHVEQTEVTFAPMTRIEIESYVDSGEPFDKAGGYAIQEHSELIVANYRGSFTNIVGLPLETTKQILTRCGLRA